MPAAQPRYHTRALRRDGLHLWLAVAGYEVDVAQGGHNPNVSGSFTEQPTHVSVDNPQHASAREGPRMLSVCTRDRTRWLGNVPNPMSATGRATLAEWTTFGHARVLTPRARAQRTPASTPSRAEA
jgi:hypothetical protein